MAGPSNDGVRDSFVVQYMQPNLARVATLIRKQPEDNKLPESSSLSEPSSYLIHDTKGKAICCEQLEDLLKELEEIKEDSNSSCSKVEKCGERKLNHMNNFWRNQQQQETPLFDTSRSKGKLPMENFGAPAYGGEQQPESASNSSFVHTCPLGASRTYARTLNSEGPGIFLRDFQSRQPQSSFGFKNADHMCERKMHWHDLCGQDASFGESKRASPKWSEEELDSLWIGVRRYGQDNWTAILADSTLCFYSSRTVEDLADQWDREREITLNGVCSAQTRLPRSRFWLPPFVINPAVNNHHYAGKTTLPRYPNIQTFRAEEPGRTPGDSPLHQYEANTEASFPHLTPGVIMATPISYRAPSESPLGSTPLRSSYPMTGVSQIKNDEVQIPKLHFEASTSYQKPENTPKERKQSPPKSSAYRLTKTSNIVDWVLGLPAPNSMQMRNRRWVSPVFSSCIPPVASPIPAPPATVSPQHGHGVRKRKNGVSDNSYSSTKVSENAPVIDEAWLRKRLCISPSGALIFQIPTTSEDSGGNQKDNNLVVTDTGDSSEGTISDH